MDEIELKHQIIAAAKQLHQQNMLAAADGNISYRVNDERILITPSGRAKSAISLDDIAIITLDNHIISGHPSSERLMHLAVYQQCPQARSVVHAHPPTAIAWSVAHPELQYLPDSCLSELIIACGRVPIVAYARPGTQAMGELLIPFLPEHRIMILARHGAVAWGESVEEACYGIERVEHTASILLKAYQLGGISNLPDEEVIFLRELRKKLGDKIL